jgi:hypothetical protein
MSVDGGAAALASLPAAAAEEVGWWRLQRLKLLQLIDRLELAMVSIGVHTASGLGLSVVYFCEWRQGQML